MRLNDLTSLIMISKDKNTVGGHGDMVNKAHTHACTQQSLLPGGNPSTFLQPVNGSKNSVMN